MERKVLFVLIDGLADVSNEQLSDKTYLQYANLPSLDKIAASG
jgi:2,3-bisphosphoglycerate-independent phosphoglycerate mutase